MSDQNYNPIKSVNGVQIPVPSSYKYILSDISASDAGRTEDMEMHKNRLGQYRKLELEWSGVDLATVSQVLQAFNAETFTVEFLDAYTGNYQTSEFYAGDRSSPLYNAKMGLWENLAFNIIEVGGRNVSGN